MRFEGFSSNLEVRMRIYKDIFKIKLNNLYSRRTNIMQNISFFISSRLVFSQDYRYYWRFFSRLDCIFIFCLTELENYLKLIQYSTIY